MEIDEDYKKKYNIDVEILNERVRVSHGSDVCGLVR